MRRLIYRYVATLVTGVLLFALARLLFMAVNAGLYAGVSFADICAVLWHGVAMDMSVSAYIAIIPAIGWGVALWTGSEVVDRVMRWYFGVVAAVMSLLLMVDAVLYGYWQFRLDVTPFNYFISSPASSLASAEWWQMVVGVPVWAAVGYGIYQAYAYIVLRLCGPVGPLEGRARVWGSVSALVLTALLFVPIRGGVTVSTMNPSRAYYSSERRLNHAAVNPLFSLLYSATHQSDFGSQYRYYDDAEASRLFRQICDPEVPDGVRAHSHHHPLLSTSRPDIFIIILESFSSHLFPSLGGEPVAVGLDSIASQGLLWDNFYATSFRTDRAIPGIISGYPGQPGTSIMKYVSKTENLPSLSRELKEQAGYRTEYYYGGDINFCNQQAYLVSAGFDKIISDKDFAVGERLSKWGVHDDVLLRRVVSDLRHYDPSAPVLRVIQTSSSHEPFDVPYAAPQFDDKRAVAFAYTDSCVTRFVRRLERSPRWRNSLVVIVPDHYGAWPEQTDPVARHRIPLIMTGGALSRRGVEHTVGAQPDIAPTILSGLGLSHGQFTFGVDLLDSAAPHRAYFADPSYIGFITDDNTLVYDLDGDRAEIDTGAEPGKNIPYARAYLQTLYDDLERR